MPGLESESDSTPSSIVSDRTRIPSPELQTQPAQETTAGDNRDQQDGKVSTEATPADDDSDSKTSLPSNSAPDPDVEPLHLVWEGELGAVEETRGRSYFIGAELVDYVVVPGVYGDWEGDVGECPGSGSSAWVPKFAGKRVVEDPFWAKTISPECRVLSFRYDASQFFRGRQSRESIRQMALKLLRALKARRQNAAKKRRIFFVCHDIGGIIVKDALALAALEGPRWRDISEMSRLLASRYRLGQHTEQRPNLLQVFTGCPHRSFNKTDMEDRLTRFLFTNYDPSDSKVQPSVPSIPGLADAVIEINGLFAESKVPLRSRVISLYSQGSASSSICPAFDSYSATLGIPLERRLPEPSNTKYTDLKDYIKLVNKDINPTLEPKQYQYERSLLALASPVYPLKTGESSNFLNDLPEYQAWLNHRAPQILYIHGNHRVREAAEQVFYSLESTAENLRKRSLVLYFSFDRWDVRCDSIRDLIATFLAQIITHFPKLNQQLEFLFNQLHNERGWTETDLVQFFEWFRNFRSAGDVEEVMCVINYFDECTSASRKKFLDNFIYVSQNVEMPWKVVVTSHRPGALTEELSGLFCVPIDLAASGLESYADNNVERDLASLTILRPDLLSQDTKVREELKTIEELEPSIRQIICEQARLRGEWPEETSIQKLLEPLDLTKGEGQDDKVLGKVLNWVLRNFPDQGILRRLFSWLLYSVRPLTVWELATVLSFETAQDRGGVAPRPSEVEILISKIQKWLAGIIDVDQNEVRFRHPRLRNFMAGEETTQMTVGEPRYLWEEIKETAHSDIAELCLKYLSRTRTSVEQLLNETFQVSHEAFEAPTFADRTNLASYTIQAWTHHFSLSSSRLDLSTLLSEFESLDLTRTLARAHWALANQITKSIDPPDTLFPIFVGLELLDAVKPQDEKDVFRGLLEAARKGKAGVVQKMTAEHNFSPDQLMKALEAASSSGDEKLMLHLLDQIMSKIGAPGGIEWPPLLIYRAAWLGLDRFTDKILALGCPPDPEVEWTTTLKASPLFQASRAGHSKTVRTLVKHGANLKFTGGLNERTPLHLAAVEGHTEVARILLEEDMADIDAPCDNNFTPLYLASVYGHYETLELLLKMGADPNMGIPPGPGDDEQWVPLVVASDDGLEKCVRLLLDNGANPDISGPSGTPLRWAASSGHLEVCNMLLAAGADPNSELLKMPILHQIYQSTPKDRLLRILDRFLELGLDVNAKNSNGDTTVLFAMYTWPAKFEDFKVKFMADHDRLVATRKLLDHGADPNIINNHGSSPLYRAVIHERYEVVELLLERGANIDQVDLNVTPVMGAVERPEILRLLLEKGANPDLGKRFGETPLIYSVEGGLTESVELLLEYNASIDLEYDSEAEHASQHLAGWTALRFAVTAGPGNSGMVRRLAEAGANLTHKADGVPIICSAAKGEYLQELLEFLVRIDIDQADDEGFTAVHRVDTTFDNLKRLLNAGANIKAETTRSRDTPLSVAVTALDGLARAKLLLERGASINRGSPWNGSPLYQACRKGEWETVKFLVEQGANVNQPCDGMPGTPLQAICLRGEEPNLPSPEEMIRYLLDEEEEHPHARSRESRADVTVQGGLLGFPINAAALRATPNVINLILDQKGATVDVRDNMGRMPIHFAALNGIRNFEVILDKGGDINAKDKMGRTALHWAAQAGHKQVVKRIISLLSDKTAIDAPDIDGWTPLCWAARRPASWLEEEHGSESPQQKEVITLLLENGANRTALANVGHEKWTPLEIGRFSACSKGAMSLLAHGVISSGASEGLERPNKVGEPDKYRSQRGYYQNYWCDACEWDIRGFAYVCKTCADAGFCSKCHRHAAILHPFDHEFEQRGPELAGSEDEGSDDDSTSATTESTDSDSGSESDGSG